MKLIACVKRNRHLWREFNETTQIVYFWWSCGLCNLNYFNALFLVKIKKKSSSFNAFIFFVQIKLLYKLILKSKIIVKCVKRIGWKVKINKKKCVGVGKRKGTNKFELIVRSNWMKGNLHRSEQWTIFWRTKEPFVAS